jgi:peptidoglycan hydrolase-like protein with peptidoglycan-binding domain
VAATLDQVLLYGGAPALTMFAAADGGFTKSGGLPYLPAKADPWDQASGSTSSVWRATLPVSALTPLVPSGDRVTSVAIGGRDGNGDLGGTPSVVVVDSVSATGTAHRTTTTPARVRSLWAWPSAPSGLRSDWFAILGAPAPGSPVSAPVRGTSVAPPPAPHLPLRTGSRGAAVVSVQRLLKVSTTAYYGPLTTAAVKRWQAAKHLPPTGIVDARTWTAMRLTPLLTSVTRTTAATTPTKPAGSVITPALPLKAGSHGASVLSVQRLLKVSASGYYGALTTAAVRRWQAAKRLPATGVVDARTWTAMRLSPAVKTAVRVVRAPAAPTFALRRGSKGADVVRIQRVLRVSATGFYGPLTAAAVLSWQRAHRLPATGVVDTRTWNALGLPRR